MIQIFLDQRPCEKHIDGNVNGKVPKPTKLN